MTKVTIQTVCGPSETRFWSRQGIHTRVGNYTCRNPSLYGYVCILLVLRHVSIHNWSLFVSFACHELHKWGCITWCEDYSSDLVLASKEDHVTKPGSTSQLGFDSGGVRDVFRSLASIALYRALWVSAQRRQSYTKTLHIAIKRRLTKHDA
jgi:hypothetical protein